MPLKMPKGKGEKPKKEDKKKKGKKGKGDKMPFTPGGKC